MTYLRKNHNWGSMDTKNVKLDDIFKSNQTLNTGVNSDDLCTDLEVSALLAKSSVPYSHRRIANNYVTLRRICPFQVVQPRITKVEQAMLSRYLFSTLENTTISRVNRELSQLKDWATSTDDTLRNDSNEILNIRVKELKFILSNSYTSNTNEMFKGYKAVEAYLVNITKYYR